MKKRAYGFLAAALALCLLFLSACGGGMSEDWADGGDSSPGAYPPDGSMNDGWANAESVPGDYYTSPESYLAITENAEKYTGEDSLISFSLKVDTAAYTNVQRYIENGSVPPADAVRIEEMINYFSYDEQPTYRDGPFSFYTEIGPSPMDPTKYIAMVRVKTDEIDKSELPGSNLVFLIDTSGSMDSYDKLPLLKEAFSLLVETLDGGDTVSIVTYAGSSRVVLSGARGDQKSTILSAINNLSAGGSTAGADGIKTAYALAEEYYISDGNNRVILATDGDFNVGINSVDDLADFIGEKRGGGVYLSVLGFGTGNIRDDIMETLATNGNGNYSYINSLSTAQKVLVEELGTNLFTVAEDVKAQVEFNPANVSSYRLIGYENRTMSNEDFTNDQKDAGEVGAGTDIVLLFEIGLVGDDDGLKYSDAPPTSGTGAYPNELFEVRVAYKQPGGSASSYIALPVSYASIRATNTSDFNFACSVAAFGHILRGSEFAGSATVDSVIALARGNLGRDSGGYRSGFLDMVYDYKGRNR